MLHKCQYSHKSIQVTKQTFLELYNREAIKTCPKVLGIWKIPQIDQAQSKYGKLLVCEHNKNQYF